MERLLMEDLIKWKNKKNRRPLVLKGARQVGKTYLIKEFGSRYFKRVAYFNFEKKDSLKFIFENDFNTKRIIEALSIESGIDIDKDTLIIFDEIQEAPRAFTSLKYFSEDNPEYAIIVAGSFMGTLLNKNVSFPVGKVDELMLYPMNFVEFLMAKGEDKLVELLKKNDQQMINLFHDRYIELLKKYYIVGGMPSIVLNYIENESFRGVREEQRLLLDFYRGDLAKHAKPSMIEKIFLVWDSITYELSKENKKFIYGYLKEGARAKEFEEAIKFLQDCLLINISYNVSKPGYPLPFYKDKNAFKIYFLDVGLFSALSKIDEKVILNGSNVFTEAKGALTEQFVAEELRSQSIDLFYFKPSSSTLEIDFLFQGDDYIAPIEVKAETNLKSKSLSVYREKYSPKLSVRTSLSKFKEEERLVNVPLYALFSYLKNES